jgi:nicotinamidase-related amidase
MASADWPTGYQEFLAIHALHHRVGTVIVFDDTGGCWSVGARNHREEAMFCSRHLLRLAALAAVLAYAAPAPAQTIIDEWQNVKAPPAPELKAVTVDPRTTALLMLDFVPQSCSQQRRPRCLATLSKAKKLLAEARAKDMLVVYSLTPVGSIGETLPEVAPTGKEPFVQSGVDKFYKTNLEQILKDKDIKTVIVIGTGANGTVIYTASGAVLRGMKVIVPVDVVSDVNVYMEQYVAYHLMNAPIIAGNVTLTSVDMMKF